MSFKNPDDGELGQALERILEDDVIGTATEIVNAADDQFDAQLGRQLLRAIGVDDLQYEESLRPGDKNAQIMLDLELLSLFKPIDYPVGLDTKVERAEMFAHKYPYRQALPLLQLMDIFEPEETIVSTIPEVKFEAIRQIAQLQDQLDGYRYEWVKQSAASLARDLEAIFGARDMGWYMVSGFMYRTAVASLTNDDLADRLKDLMYSCCRIANLSGSDMTRVEEIYSKVRKETVFAWLLGAFEV